MSLCNRGDGFTMPHMTFQDSTKDLVLRILKYPVILVCGLTVTLSLLYLMQSLIDGGEKALKETNNLRIVEFTRIKAEPELQTKTRKAKPPQPPDEPPPPLEPDTTFIAKQDAWSSHFTAPPPDLTITNAVGFQSDGEYLPIIKVQPVYPRFALEKGLFGWVMLEFTVDEIGRVTDPVILSNCVETFSKIRTECVDSPGTIFNKPAISAALKFKYKPRVIDGSAIATAGVKHRITFELDEMQNL